MLACVAVQSLSPGADYATFEASSAAVVAALRSRGACLLRLSASDAHTARYAVLKAKAGFQDASGTGARTTSELPRCQLLRHGEQFQVREHDPTLRHPAGAAAQEVNLVEVANHSRAVAICDIPLLFVPHHGPMAWALFVIA